MFTAAVHDAARAIAPSPRGELEITDAIQHLVDNGARVEPHIVRGWWKDTGRLEDMLEANRLILDKIGERIEGELIDSQVDGRVVVEAGARLERTVVRGPAIIGAGRAPERLLHRPVHGDRRALRDLRRGGRALDPARGLLRQRPRRSARVLPAGPQRDRRPRHQAAARIPADGRGQLEHLHHLRLLLTGAAGMLGLDVLRAGERAGHEVVPPHAVRARRHRRRERARGRGARRPRRGRELRRLDRRRRRRVPARAGARRQRGRRREHRRRRGLGRRPAAARLHRLRLRRAAPARLRAPPARLRGVGPDRRRGRSTARASSPASGWCSPPARATASCAPRGCSGSAGATSPTRCSGSPASATRVQVVTDQVGCPTWTGHLAPGLLGLIERGVSGLVHLAGSGRVSWNGYAAEIFRQAELGCEVQAGHQRADGPPGAPPGVVRARVRARGRAARCRRGRTGWRGTSLPVLG